MEECAAKQEEPMRAIVKSIKALSIDVNNTAREIQNIEFQSDEKASCPENPIMQPSGLRGELESARSLLYDTYQILSTIVNQWRE